MKIGSSKGKKGIKWRRNTTVLISVFLIVVIGFFVLIYRKFSFSGVEENVERLNYPSHNVRLRAANSLLFWGERAVTPLIDAVETGDDTTKYIAAQILGKLGDPKAILPLLKMLNDDNPYIREETIAALGKFGDRQVVGSLIRSLADEENRVRAQAALSLGNLRDSLAIEPLINTLQDPDAVVRKNALISLQKFVNRRILNNVFPLTKDCDVNVRYIAVQIVGMANEELTLEYLIAALNDENQSVRQRAAFYLGRSGQREAVGPLKELLATGKAKDQEAATHALKELTGVEYVLSE